MVLGSPPQTRSAEDPNMRDVTGTVDSIPENKRETEALLLLRQGCPV